MWTRASIRSALRMGAMVLAFLVLTAIGEILPFMRALDAAIAQAQGSYQTAAIVILAIGFVAFMGAVIFGL